MKESKVITQSSVRSQYFLFQQYSSSFSICMVHIYLHFEEYTPEGENLMKVIPMEL